MQPEFRVHHEDSVMGRSVIVRVSNDGAYAKHPDKVHLFIDRRNTYWEHRDIIALAQALIREARILTKNPLMGDEVAATIKDT